MTHQQEQAGLPGKTEVLRFRAERKLRNRVKKLASRQSVSESHILRQAVIEYMERATAKAA